MTPLFWRNQISSLEDIGTIDIGFSSLGGAPANTQVPLSYLFLSTTVSSSFEPCMTRYSLASRLVRFLWETAHPGRCVGRNHRLRHKIAPCEANCCVRSQAHRVSVTGRPLAPLWQHRGGFPLSPPPHDTRWLSCCRLAHLCVCGAAADRVRA